MTNQSDTPVADANSAAGLADGLTKPDPFKNKRVIVLKHGSQREIKMLLVVENFRFAFYITFYFMLLVGVLLTFAFVEEDDPGSFLRDVFGVVSICVNFDQPPSTYVLPSLWSICLVFVYAYAIVWLFRVWIAMEEQNVSRCSFVGYCIGFSYVVLSFIFFTTVFAVQPERQTPNTMVIHTVPFTNFMIALWVMAVMITHFGNEFVWKNMGLPRWFFVMNRAMLYIQSFVVVGKVLHHINCLSDINGGLWWDPNASGKIVIDILDKLLLISVLLYPTFQSAYLSGKRSKTDCVFMSLQDNRKSRVLQTEMMSLEETRDF